MKRAWEEVAAYVANNAHNPRKGYRLRDLSDKEQLHLTVVEMLELVASPDSIDEMADVLACLFHYAMRKGWTIEAIEDEVIRKLALRFPETANVRHLIVDVELESKDFVPGQWNDPRVIPADRSGN